ncbi:MAG: DUF177 domain-containing protein [Alphaproteobacteria bacterium]|jgi:uncharacterized metal-binding protein YceD (DUF177 family)
MTRNDAPAVEFSHVVDLEDLPEEGTEIALSADSDERAALAARFGLLSIDRMEARLSLTWLEPEEVLSMTGELTAAVVQTCVVSLEPVPAEISASIDVVFARDTDRSSEFVAPEEAEPLEGETLDVGEFVAEELSLCLDPYPRHPDLDPSSVELGPGASLSTEEESAAESRKNSPFQVLADLKSKL